MAGEGAVVESAAEEDCFRSCEIDVANEDGALGASGGVAEAAKLPAVALGVIDLPEAALTSDAADEEEEVLCVSAVAEEEGNGFFPTGDGETEKALKAVEDEPPLEACC